MEILKKLLLQNKAWAKWNTEVDSEYFESMSKDQKPEILWIGCSDSRVPPDEVINTKPGTLFVHRNIANLVYESDQNLMSVMEYAVKYLKVNYVIVCGHYNCGGVRAALEGIDNERLKNWTRSISENISKSSGAKDLNSVVELNVIKQVEALQITPVIQEAWKNSEYPKLVGWVYDLKSGLIKELKFIDPKN
jgi:carbonic anhydrase